MKLLILGIAEYICTVGLKHLSACLRHPSEKLYCHFLSLIGQGMSVKSLSADVVVDSCTVVHDNGHIQFKHSYVLLKSLYSAPCSHGEVSAETAEAVDSFAVGIGYLLFRVQQGAVHIAEDDDF